MVKLGLGGARLKKIRGRKAPCHGVLVDKPTIRSDCQSIPPDTGRDVDQDNFAPTLHFANG